MPGKTITGRSHDEVELEFLRSLGRRCPRDVGILKALGDQLTQCGHYTEGLEADVQLAELCPDDALVFYNLACSLALTGKPGDALDALARAVELGYHDDAFAAEDKDLRSLRNDQRFAELLQEMRINADALDDDKG